MHEQIQGVDHFVLRDLEPGCPAPMYRDAAKPDITATPVPRFDLVKVGLYETMPVQYSRGCPFE